MKKDLHYTSRLLNCAGGLFLVSGVLMAVSASLVFGGILAVGAFCMFVAAYNFKIAENKKTADNTENKDL